MTLVGKQKASSSRVLESAGLRLALATGDSSGYIMSLQPYKNNSFMSHSKLIKMFSC